MDKEMKTFDLVSSAIMHSRKSGEIGIAVIPYDFTIFANLNVRPAGEFFVCKPNREIVVAEYFEAK